MCSENYCSETIAQIAAYSRALSYMGISYYVIGTFVCSEGKKLRKLRTFSCYGHVVCLKNAIKYFCHLLHCSPIPENAHLFLTHLFVMRASALKQLRKLRHIPKLLAMGISYLFSVPWCVICFLCLCVL